MPSVATADNPDIAEPISALVCEVPRQFPSTTVFFNLIYAKVTKKTVVEIKTVATTLTQEISQFLLKFAAISRQLNYLVTLSTMGSLGRGKIAGGITDLPLLTAAEESLTNLLQRLPQLKSPVAHYFQASPADSSAEAKLTNRLIQSLLDTLAETFCRTLQALKYARIQWCLHQVKTNKHYQLEIINLTIQSGSIGNWNKILNNPAPNKIYLVDGNKIYHTDEVSRVKRLDALLKLETLDRNTYQQLKTGQQGIDGDEGGHLIAAILNGSGEKINLLPMNANLNRGAWQQIENIWAKALKQGKTVHIKIEPTYTNSTIRPSSFRIRYAIDSGQPTILKLDNGSGSKQ